MGSRTEAAGEDGQVYGGLTTAKAAYQTVSCANPAAPDATGAVTLRVVDVRLEGNGRYNARVRMPSLRQGTCLRVLLDLGDGALHTALFRLG